MSDDSERALKRARADADIWYERAQLLEKTHEGLRHSLRQADERTDKLIKLIDKFTPWLRALHEGRSDMSQILDALGRNRVALDLPPAPPSQD